MLKLKQNHTSRDVKVLTDQLVDSVSGLTSYVPKTGNLTLAVSVTSTLVTDARVVPQSVILFSAISPTSQGLTHHVAATGQFTVFHDSSTDADRTFAYVIF